MSPAKTSVSLPLDRLPGFSEPGIATVCSAASRMGRISDSSDGQCLVDVDPGRVTPRGRALTGLWPASEVGSQRLRERSGGAAQRAEVHRHPAVSWKLPVCSPMIRLMWSLTTDGPEGTGDSLAIGATTSKTLAACARFFRATSIQAIRKRRT